MKIFVHFALLLVNIRLSWCCEGEQQVLFCSSIPTDFSAGFSTLRLSLRDVGEINSTVLNSDKLNSITRVTFERAGVTAIAEGAFSSLVNLRDLRLNQNLLTGVSSRWFGRPYNLGKLFLAGNRIENVSESMFSGLIGLRLLNLTSNRITEIQAGSFSSLQVLSELDLSDNRMTRVSPQVFRSLTTTRIGLGGNPWDCSCGAEEFVDFLKYLQLLLLSDLQNASRLVRQEQVTCASPPSLRGLPVWNVSVCLTTTPPSTVTQTSRPGRVSATTTHFSARPPAGSTSQTSTSVHPRPEDLTKSNTAANTAFSLTSSSSFPSTPSPQKETSVHPRPSDPMAYTPSTHTGIIETRVTSRPSPLSPNTVCTLIAVIAVLSTLLSVVCFLGALRWRKHNKKTVTPESPEETKRESREGGSRLSGDHSPETEKDQWYSVVSWRTSVTGVRTVRSAHAALCPSPFCAAVKGAATLRTETRLRGTGSDGQQEVRKEDGEQEGRETEYDVKFEIESQNNIPDESSPEGGNLPQGSECAGITADALPYLSIGMNQNKVDDVTEQLTDGQGQRSTMGKAMGRISTWPPTAIQWQARCKKMQEEEGSDDYDVWTPGVASEVKKVLNFGPHHDRKQEGTWISQTDGEVKINDVQMDARLSQIPKQTDKTTSVGETLADVKLEEEETCQNLVSAGQPNTEATNVTTREPGQTLKPEKTQRRSEASRAESRGTASSKRPSGGVTPNDETLLSGNDYVFMDLLHEVTQNKGRWTRERWKQVHTNKPGRKERGADSYLK